MSFFHVVTFMGWILFDAYGPLTMLFLWAWYAHFNNNNNNR